MEQLGINVADFAERIFPSIEDREFAREFLASVSQPIIAIHPGSGSHEKNWPLENWIGLFSPDSRFADLERLLVISGEADEAQTDQLEREWKNRNVRFARNLPLPSLAAVLGRSIFIGHDSGISHLAAAAGANCILLFGPTDPDRPKRSKKLSLACCLASSTHPARGCSARCPQRIILLRRDCGLYSSTAVGLNFRIREETSDAISKRSR